MRFTVTKAESSITKEYSSRLHRTHLIAKTKNFSEVYGQNCNKLDQKDTALLAINHQIKEVREEFDRAGEKEKQSFVKYLEALILNRNIEYILLYYPLCELTHHEPHERIKFTTHLGLGTILEILDEYNLHPVAGESGESSSNSSPVRDLVGDGPGQEDTM